MSWLDSLRVGDMVIVSKGPQDKTPRKIIKLTVNRIVLEGEKVRFRRSDGMAVGKWWGLAFIRPYTYKDINT